MKRIGIVALVLVLLVGAGGWMLVSARPKPVKWTTKKADRGDLMLTITASGTVEPLTSVMVGSQASGKVKEVLVDADARIKKGQVLAALDTELLEADRKDKEIALKQVRTSLEMLDVEREGLTLKEAKLKLLLERERIAVERSRAALQLAAKNMQRYQDLYRADAVAQTELDIRTLEKENAGRDLALQQNQSEQIALEILQVAEERKSLAARVRQAEAAGDQARQMLGKAETNLAYASITAPCDGLVLDRMVEPGQTISAVFQTPTLFKLVADLQTVRIQSMIEEGDVGKIRAGQKVNFEVDAYRGEKFSGLVRAVRLKSENRQNLVTYPVIIEAANPASADHPYGKLLPGMTAYLTFEVECKKDVLRVSTAALRFVPPEGAPVDRTPDAPPSAQPAEAPEGTKAKERPLGLPATLYRPGAGGLLKALAVRVGDNDGEYYELLSGEVRAGDELIIGAEGAGATTSATTSEEHP